MKKLFVLLLAFIMPLYACAETYELTIETKANQTSFLASADALVRNALDATAEESSSFVQALYTLLKDSALTITMQDDAATVSVRVAGGTLFDVAIHEAANVTAMTSSLLPGYALLESTENAMPLTNGWDITETPALRNSIKLAFDTWLKDMEPESTRGVFEGDAYQGGTQCTTWMLTDQDIAACVSLLLTKEVREFISTMLDAVEMDTMDILGYIDEINARVAEEDRYMYILRIVQDDMDKVIGLSLTVMETIEQVATISIGIEEKQLRVVIGLGLSEQNYWCEYTLQANQRDHLTFLKGSCREWMADKLSTFAYVRETGAPIAANTWNCNVSKQGKRYLWDGKNYAGEAADPDEQLLSFTGSIHTGTPAFDAEWNLLPAADTPLKMRVSFKPTQAIQPLDDTLIQVSAEDPVQAETYQELLQTFYAELTMRMIKLLPMDVILTLGEWFSLQ